MAWFFATEYKDREQGTYYAPELERIPEEEERFNAMRAALAKKLWAEWKAGDQEMDTPVFPNIHFQAGPKLLEGWAFPMFEEPLRARLVHQEGAIVDIVNSTFGTWAISQKVIDIIESIEPGVHRYLPFELIQPDGSVHPDRRWLLNVCARAEVVDTERSNVVWLKGRMPRKFADLHGKKHLILKACEMTTRTLWYEWRYNTSPRTFASDRLWDALQAAGIRGWQPYYSYPHHIEEA